jgi:hypothetical protein
MRLCAYKDSPYFDERLTAECRVFVDGVEVRDCVELSEEDGWAILCDYDDTGHFLIKDDEVVTYRLDGLVEVVILPRRP